MAAEFLPVRLIPALYYNAFEDCIARNPRKRTSEKLAGAVAGRIVAEEIAADLIAAGLIAASQIRRKKKIEHRRCYRTETERGPSHDRYRGFSSSNKDDHALNLSAVIVFQHDPPPLIYRLIEMALHSLQPGGIAHFQVPTYGLNYGFSVDEYLARDRKPGMEMHVIPQPAVFLLAAEAGCELLEVREDSSVGRVGEWIFNTFTVRKRVRETPSRGVPMRRPFRFWLRRWGGASVTGEAIKT